MWMYEYYCTNSFANQSSYFAIPNSFANQSSYARTIYSRVLEWTYRSIGYFLRL